MALTEFQKRIFDQHGISTEAKPKVEARNNLYKTMTPQEIEESHRKAREELAAIARKNDEAKKNNAGR